MAYNENINLFVTTDRNNADVFNAPLEKIIENIEDTRAYLNQLQAELDQLESRVQSEYTPTEQLNDLLATGIKGDKGDTGESLEYNWDGTALGVKLESESDFTYRELKGEPGDVSTEQLEEALDKKMNIVTSYLNSPSGDLLDTTTSPLVLCAISSTNNASLYAILNDSFAYVTTYFYSSISETSNRFQVAVGYAKDKMAFRRYKSGWGNWTELVTASDIPTTLPASDVYDWAKAPTKPTYTASEVGALASNGTATNASKVANALTLQIAGTTKNTFNGSSAQTFNIPNATTSTAGVMTSAMVTKLNGIATGANLIKTSKNTAKFSSQSAFTPIISSCIIGNNTVGSVWIFTGYISYNISSAPSAGNSILSINKQMTQCEDVTIICPCMTANNAYITLRVSGGTLYYQSYTGSAPTSGSRYFVSAVIPVDSTSLLS